MAVTHVRGLLLIIQHALSSEGDRSGLSSMSMKSVAAGRFLTDVTAMEERVPATTNLDRFGEVEPS